jgi:hypothetical protein
MQNKSLTPLTKIIFWFVAVNALAGALALMFLPARTDTLFFWTIQPPINAALFGALYLGGAAVVGWLTYRGEWEPARFLIPVLVSAGFFITITTFLHLDRFVPGFKLFYWLVIYIGAPLLALGVYFVHERGVLERGGANWMVSDPVKPLTQGIALTLGAILIALGIAIQIAPGRIVPVWPWPTSPLMLRIFASWFSAFGVGLLWFYFDRDWQRVKYIANLMIAASALDLLMIFIHRADLTSTGVSLWVYLFHLAMFGAVGLVMHGIQRRT